MGPILRSSSLPEGCARLSWAAFDVAVDAMAVMAQRLAPSARAIFGVPRGGLPLAVGLSHRLGLPLLGSTDDLSGVIVVDDVVETGETLRWLAPRAALFLCWVSKSYKVPAHHIIRLPKSAWVIFPWETPENAAADAADYLKRRGKT